METASEATVSWGKMWTQVSSTPDMFQFADVTGDGRSDAVFFNTDYGTVTVGVSNGSSFRAITAFDQPWWEHGPSTPNMLKLADVNGDGKADAIYFDTQRSRGVWVGIRTAIAFAPTATGANSGGSTECLHQTCCNWWMSTATERQMRSTLIPLEAEVSGSASTMGKASEAQAPVNGGSMASRLLIKSSSQTLQAMAGQMPSTQTPIEAKVFGWSQHGQ